MTDRPHIVRGLPLHRIAHFAVAGQQRDLKEPEGLATPRQLYRLNALGLLAVVEPDQVVPVTKGEAAYAIDVTA